MMLLPDIVVRHQDNLAFTMKYGQHLTGKSRKCSEKLFSKRLIKLQGDILYVAKKWRKP